MDFCVMYHDEGINTDVAADAEKHREAFARYEAAGFTWMVVGGRTMSTDAHRDWVEGFGASYLEGRS
jgi:hypothetical protein